ncbi:hypothetical protein M0802_004893 [Mischocyttarus mexicanus]|nr:hypothetical protein M0802_004893 [Mischocyttarus mexicanus]
MGERKRSALLVIKVKPGIRVKRTPMETETETERECVVFRRKRIMPGRTRGVGEKVEERRRRQQEEEEEKIREGGGVEGERSASNQ